MSTYEKSSACQFLLFKIRKWMFNIAVFKITPLANLSVYSQKNGENIFQFFTFLACNEIDYSYEQKKGFVSWSIHESFAVFSTVQ